MFPLLFLKEDKMPAKKPCETYLILECIDDTEYGALTAGNKKKVDLILSCGTVNTNVGNSLRTTLEAIFPSGVTRTALDILWTRTPPPTP